MLAGFLDSYSKIQAWSSTISRQQFGWFICCILMCSLIYSKFALSTSMIALLFISIFNFDLYRKIPLYFNPEIKRNFNRLKRSKIFLSVTMFFFIVALGGFYSSDLTYLIERLRIKLPFLLLPFAFVTIPSFTKMQHDGLYYILLMILCFSGLEVGLNYWNNFEEINQNLSKGQAIPTPMSHIRYSLLMALSILGGIVLIFKKFYFKFKIERLFILIMTLFLFGFIHVLSVRSGLLALYLGLIGIVLLYIFRTGKIWMGILVMAGLFLIPTLAYQFIPSFKNKVHYSFWDLSMYEKGEGAHYSDSERIISIQTGLDIGKSNFIFGVGSGDLKKEVHEKYAAEHPEIKSPKMPHNQLLSVFAGTGLLGLILFLATFFFPIFYFRNKISYMLLGLLIVIFISFMMENTIENAIGVALYAFFLLFELNFLNKKGDIGYV